MGSWSGQKGDYCSRSWIKQEWVSHVMLATVTLSPPSTFETQPEHGLRDVGVHKGHSTLQLQHLHHHTVTLCWHSFIQAQAQCRVLALEGGLGTKRDMAGKSGAL